MTTGIFLRWLPQDQKPFSWNSINYSRFVHFGPSPLQSHNTTSYFTTKTDTKTQNPSGLTIKTSASSNSLLLSTARWWPDMSSQYHFDIIYILYKLTEVQRRLKYPELVDSVVMFVAIIIFHIVLAMLNANHLPRQLSGQTWPVSNYTTPWTKKKANQVMIVERVSMGYWENDFFRGQNAK